MPKPKRRRIKQSERFKDTPDQLYTAIRNDIFAGITDISFIATMHNSSVAVIEPLYNQLLNEEEVIRVLDMQKEHGQIPHILTEEECIIQDYKEGTTVDELATVYGHNKSFISKVLNKYLTELEMESINRMRKKKEMITTEEMNDTTYEMKEDIGVEDEGSMIEVKEEEEDKDLEFPEELSKDMIPVDLKGSYITVGLVNHRHNMNVTKYIFEGVETKDMFNFTMLDQVINEFLDEVIEYSEDGIPKKSLIVRTSGLQMPLVSLIKLCYEREINLTIAHYQFTPKSNFYRQQPIFTKFKTSSDIPFFLSCIATKLTKMYAYMSKPADYDEIDKLYELFIIEKPAEAKNNREGNSIPVLDSWSILATSINNIIFVNTTLTAMYMKDRSLFRMMYLKEYIKDDSQALGYHVEVIQKSCC